MSKPEAAGSKSLEEILASIRRSLADETGGRGGAEPSPPSKAAEPAPSAAKPVPAAARSDDLASLPGKLAGALEQSAGGNGAALEEDLTDLLAPAAQKPAAPSATPQAAKPANPNPAKEGKDPLWFLSPRPAPEAKGNGAAKPAATEEVKLTRPELLRASLPPLFGAPAEATPGRSAADAGKSADAAPPADKSPSPAPHLNGAGPPATEPSLAFPPAETAAPPAGSGPEPASGEAVSPTSTLAALAAWDAKPEVEVAATPAEPAEAPLAEAAADTPDAVEPEPSPLVPVKAAFAARSDDPDPSPARTAPPGVPSPGALERTIAELLEPVIRNWLDSNLPRLAEKVIREEVARAIAAEREVPKV
jgi:cell pole-organizing protein PopZ